MISVQEVHDGLARSPKELHHGFCYGGDSGTIFDAVCHHPDYYLYRSDIYNVDQAAKEAAKLAGDEGVLVEFGCATCEKAIPLLETVKVPTFVGIDINESVLKIGEANIKKKFPDKKVLAEKADFFAPFKLPATGNPTIGILAGGMMHAFPVDLTVRMVKNCLDALGDHGILLGTFDTNKDPKTNIKGYITEPYGRFVMNALDTINNEYGANFNMDEFEHLCEWNEKTSTLDHFVVAKSNQTVTLEGKQYTFEEGEKTLIFCCYKRSVEEVGKMVASAGGEIKRTFFDKEGFACAAWMEKTK